MDRDARVEAITNAATQDSEDQPKVDIYRLQQVAAQTIEDMEENPLVLDRFHNP